jgi:glycosyltransferase involved in cell wall biosynthesis
VHVRAPGEKRAVLMGVGSLSPPRRYEDIISATAVLRDEGYDARAILVCKDFWNDAAYRTTLTELAKRLNVTDHIDFHFQGATDDELRVLQKQADFFVFPNVINIWSMASFEAMAAGMPLIVSRATSLPEVLTEGVNAVFFDAGDPKDLAAKARPLLDDPARYRAVAEAGQKYVSEHLTWRKYAEDFLAFLK